MHRIWIVCSALVVLLVAPADAGDRVVDPVHESLLSAERSLGLNGYPTAAKQAPLQQDMELKRSEYVRAIQLVLEGIESEKNLEKSRAEYEKSLIQAASSKIQIGKVLGELRRSRDTIAGLRKEALAIKRLASPL
jgi:hypothetical protein